MKIHFDLKEALNNQKRSLANIPRWWHCYWLLWRSGAIYIIYLSWGIGIFIIWNIMLQRERERERERESVANFLFAVLSSRQCKLQVKDVYILYMCSKQSYPVLSLMNVTASLFVLSLYWSHTVLMSFHSWFECYFLSALWVILLYFFLWFVLQF